MNPGYFIPMALALASVAAMALHIWVIKRNASSDGLLWIAAIALFASFYMTPKKACAAVVIVPARAPVIVVPRPAVIPRPAPAPARSAPTTEPARTAPMPVIVPVAPARPACTDERRARKECQ